MSSLHNRVQEEMRALRAKHETLKQWQVVEAARDIDSALHEDFDRHHLWDDAKAAERARLEYAGRLIRIYLVKPSWDDQAPPVRGWVSLIDDRKPNSGFPGYRRIEDVMSDEGMRANLIQTALMELRACRRKYEQLKELAAVWDAIEQADRTHRKPETETESRASA